MATHKRKYLQTPMNEKNVPGLALGMKPEPMRMGTFSILRMFSNKPNQAALTRLKETVTV